MRHYAIVRFATSHESAAAFRARYARRTTVHRKPEPPPSRYQLWAEFCELVLSHIGRLMPKRARQIWRNVGNDWGTCEERRVYRALHRLAQNGKIVRTEDGYLRAPRRMS